jgi:uncharacterized membrane protein YccC
MHVLVALVATRQRMQLSVGGVSKLLLENVHYKRICAVANVGMAQIWLEAGLDNPTTSSLKRPPDLHTRQHRDTSYLQHRADLIFFVAN